LEAPVIEDRSQPQPQQQSIQFILPDNERQAELMIWWLKTAYEDFVRTVPKIDEYGGTMNIGSADLILIGENLAVLLGMHNASDAVKQELGVWFYMQGKVARLVSNYHKQEPGKADSWFDATIYCMMARRLQEVGRWP